MKKSDGADFSSEDLAAACIRVNNTVYKLEETARITEYALPVALGAIGEDGLLTESTTRAVTDEFYIPKGVVVEANIPGYYFVFKKNWDNIIYNGTSAPWFDSTANRTYLGATVTGRIP